MAPRTVPRERSVAGSGDRLGAEEAMAFVRRHGVVLVSARGKAPTLVQAIAGEQIKGSWWGHPDGKRIFAVLSDVTASEDVLVCRLVDAKITLVHRRLWPALARLADAFSPEQIARAIEGHTPSGRHVSRAIPFPEWVPADVLAEAASLDESKALALLGEWLPSGAAGPPRQA
jgi:NAD(P)-dependent dehydrogenase (short-subunit alcohol dehydrogenase family)